MVVAVLRNKDNLSIPQWVLMSDDGHDQDYSLVREKTAGSV